MVTQKEILSRCSYRKYEIEGIDAHEKYMFDNPGEYTEWEPMTYEQFLDKVSVDEVFLNKFCVWFEESRQNYYDGIADRINKGNL